MCVLINAVIWTDGNEASYLTIPAGRVGGPSGCFGVRPTTIASSHRRQSTRLSTQPFADPRSSTGLNSLGSAVPMLASPARLLANNQAPRDCSGAPPAPATRTSTPATALAITSCAPPRMVNAVPAAGKPSGAPMRIAATPNAGDRATRIGWRSTAAGSRDRCRP